MKYCRYCGKQLEDNEVCRCQEEKFAQPQPSIEKTVPIQQSQVNLSQVKSNTLNFFLAYIKNPNFAAEAGAKSRDRISVLICAVLFILSNALAQFSVGIKAGAFKGRFMLFGFIFGLFGIFVPYVLDRIYLITRKPHGSRTELISKIILHTPATSLILLLAFIGNLASPYMFIFFCILSIFAYVISMGSVFAQCCASQQSSMLKKILIFFIILLYIIAVVILFAAESAYLYKGIYQYIEQYIYNEFAGAILNGLCIKPLMI